MKILVLDVGGTNVKARATTHPESLKIPSGRTHTPAAMVDAVQKLTATWQYDVISIGFPSPVRHGQIIADPVNLGAGWVGFDFEKAFKKPVKIVNDAVMQALGSYTGGRMLFMGLGTGLGTALVDDGHAIALEIQHLPYRKSTYEEYVGQAALRRFGRKRWENHVHAIAKLMIDALVCESIVFGGGNARLLAKLPPHARLGDNANALPGGVSLWNDVSPVAK
jgi:polyphosphate glucokinase